ncbi:MULTISPECIES: phosphatidylinositol phosphate synthase [Tsukamurella]|uniref:Phosphatidylinositol phosphate synthase n=1 Tax=Tsukamurella strandjordii TaxID=147577 RepID=A0AA90NFU0_9ACTN|nr:MULTISPECIES: CDP-alcohol phosphatidyltransferase family protein [Tsukamurella]MDP0397601.1 CDP-alcohol phosphatidyltransferase family protein [Tsukamurella strandjordii]GIZ99040.1 putative phosphatidylinositol synthase PgsA [Tsukamurella sp. TY48]
MSSIFSREAVSKVTHPIGKTLIKTGLTPDAVTLFGTVCSVTAALWLFPTDHLFAGTLVIWFFVMFDMLDGAMARARGGGTRFGAWLDATCDRIADGAIFAGLAWWAVFTEGNRYNLLIATLICLVTSQVISYAKARAEASGLKGDGGWIERPERLIIVLVGAGFTGLGVWWAIHIAMWLLAVTSIVTVFQRALSVRRSPGATDLLPLPQAVEQHGEDQA